MTEFTSDVKDRIQRFRQPNTQIESLYPIFEAINNALDAVDSKFKEEKQSKGVIDIKFLPDESQDCIASVEDNGIGLSKENFDSYSKVDTLNKIKNGGKGVGRLYWLHAFNESHVESVYENRDNEKKYRKFINTLNVPTCFKDEKHDGETGKDNFTGTKITFYGFRDLLYGKKFPKKEDTCVRYIIQHFLSVILSEDCPKIFFTYKNNEKKDLSDCLNDYIVDQEKEELNTTDVESNKFSLHMLKIKKNLGIKQHFAYLIADGRTVISKKINSLLGFDKVGERGDLFFNVCISGKIFDKNVVQDRTSFALNSNDIDEIIRKACEKAKENFLREEVDKHYQRRLKILKKVLTQYPSIDFDTPENLLKKIPEVSTDPDKMYGELSRERYRRDRKTETKIKKIIADINSKNSSSIDKEVFNKIAKTIQQEAKNSLIEYVVRRKSILSFLKQMIKNYPALEGGGDRRKNYPYEEKLHNFLCPKRDREANHELWIIDERLTYSKYLYSDEPIKNFLENSESKERPDVISFENAVFDKKFLLQENNPLKTLIVEFKRPGREVYSVEENPANQIKKYVEKILDRKIEKDINGLKIAIDRERTVFSCYVIADIVGDMNSFMDEWWDHHCLDGSKFKRLENVYKNVTIEVIPWNTLLQDANERNRAFFERLGINADFL